MMRWPLGEDDDVEDRLTRCFECLIEGLIEFGTVWEAGDGIGALVWIPPDRIDALEEAQMAVRSVYARAEDRGRRFDSLWSWIASREPDEPLAQLDSIAVEPRAQGRGIGSALIEFGLARARAGGYGVLLETGNRRNVPLYERHGFQIIEDADAPDGGPHIWFMRWDP